MALLKGVGSEEIVIDVTAKIFNGAGKPDTKVKFQAVYHDIKSDMARLREVGRRLNDPDDDYGDEALVDEFFIRFEGLKGSDSEIIEFNDESAEQVLNHRDYFGALVGGCTQALFGDRGRIKN